MRGVSIFLLLAGTVAAQDGVIQPRNWIVLEPVDPRGRMPFHTDAVFKRYLLEPGKEAPAAGYKIMVPSGVAEWKAANLSDKGRVEGRIGYAYAAVEFAADLVMLAELRGAARLFVNGAGFAGDVYRLGRGPFPVRLSKGTNHVFVSGTRGAFTFRLLPATESLVVDTRDTIKPDVVRGQSRQLAVGIRVWNATERTLEVGPVGPVAPFGAPDPQPVAPLASAVLPFFMDSKTGRDVPESVKLISVPFTLKDGRGDGYTLELTVRDAAQPYRRTFFSKIDGSIQEYAVLPPLNPDRDEMSLVLTLHGAGVDCHAQARSYSRRQDFWIIAPTNRGKFGFDWQDWGRTDAYEVLADALRWTKVSRRRVFLTGHSMGGHGAWHLAANDPDGFAAVAPSAGWCSFDTYGRRPRGAFTELWHGADGSSLTLNLITNLAQMPTFVLHGNKDDNVPVAEAERMLAALEKAGAKPRRHFQPGAGHWWGGNRSGGADCVDWPEIFDLFRRHRIPARVEDLDFTTVDPGVDADHYWVRAEQPFEYGKPMRIQAQRRGTDGRTTITTTNARAFRAFVAGPYTVDGMKLEGDGNEDTLFVKDAKGWKIKARLAPLEKRSTSCGPFKRAFSNRFVMVYGTKGSADEIQTSFERARYDAHVWSYRARGHAPLLSDAAFLASGDQYADRNVILYGNADTNAAWVACVPAGCPVQAKRGSLTVRGEQWTGDDYGAVFVYPRKGKNTLVGVFADTGVRGARLGYTLSPFVSGVGYPDFVAFKADILDDRDAGIMAAGWFDPLWK